MTASTIWLLNCIHVCDIAKETVEEKGDVEQDDFFVNQGDSDEE